MKIAMLAPVVWRTPPRKYGPWEQVASNLTEGLLKKGIDVTLFATGDSVTSGKLDYIIEKPYGENPEMDAKVCECLHISYVMEKANQFDLIHNHYDFLPLTYSKLISTPLLTTIHGFSSPSIIPVYKKYDNNTFYVSISNADRSPELHYIRTIYHGVDERLFTFNSNPEDYLLFFGRIHNDKGTYEAIQIAKAVGRKLIISGLIQDEKYFKEKVEPFINGEDILYIGNSGPEQRNKLLGGAYVLLHPINFKEPFGLSVVESFFTGTPVIAFNKGSMSELIIDGKTGFLVDNISEAIDRVKDVKLIDRKYCYEYAMQNFTLDRMVDEYIEVYKYILSIRGRP
jgi:glycosyltransferase involved in cell wall biosynthesis